MLQSESDSQLVDLLAQGLTDDEIAARLQISKRQVFQGIARLLAKLGARQRIEIVFYAYTEPEMYGPMSTASKQGICGP